MGKDLITFKGIKEGIFLNIETNDMDLIKSDLDEKIKKSGDFYKNIKILGIKANLLEENDIIDLKLLLKYKYDFIISNEDIPEYVFEKKENKPNKEKTKPSESKVDITTEGKTKFIKGTIRSGQSIEYDGNIVVIGDVNPGAVLKASGNIIVLGSLRGYAYAGDGGNLKAIVASYNLRPMQLRIGEYISRSPDDIEDDYNKPEIAKICRGNLVIEPYLPNK